MSTRALYTFTDADSSWNVYKHHDGYPTGAAEALTRALTFAWPLPRFEADEFACAFVAANKGHYYHKELELLRDLERLSRGETIIREAGEYVEGSGWKPAKLTHVKLSEELEHCRDYSKNYNGGGIRMMPQGDPLAVAKSNCQDIEYHYAVSQNAKGKLIVVASSARIPWGDDKRPKLTKLFACELSTMPTRAKALEDKEAA